MATYFARKAGNINAADVWATTPTGTAADVFSTFTADDILVANSFTVTVNVNTTVAQIRNDALSGATAGGSFAMSVNNVTLTASVLSGSATCVSTSGATSISIVGNVNAGSGNAVTHNSSGLLTVIGSVTGGTGGIGIQWLSGTLTVTGSVTGGTSTIGINVGAVGLSGLTITGNITGGSGGSGSGTPNGAATITGTVTGGGSATAYGIAHGTNGTVAIAGTAVGSVGSGVHVGSTGTLTATRAKGGPLATSAVGVSTASSGTVIVDEIEYGDLGASPTSGSVRFADKTSNVAIGYRPGLAKKTLVDAASTALLPAAADVRSGVSYNAGQTTGTCAMPTAPSVMVGVPVDATTGTAYLTPAGFWDFLTSSATTAGSMGERLKNCATVASTGQQIADAVGA